MGTKKKLYRSVAAIILTSLMAGSVLGVSNSQSDERQNVSQNPVITELFRNSYHVWELMRNSKGIYLDKKRLKGSDNQISSTANIGIGLYALCIADAMGWEPNARELALTTLKSMTGHTPNFNPQRNPSGYLRHWINMSTGATEWNSNFSTIDTGILITGVLFAKNYFSDDSVTAYANELWHSIDFTAAIADPQFGKIYRSMSETGTGGKVGTESAVFNEYMIVAWLAKNDPIRDTADAQQFWDKFYLDPNTNIPFARYGGYDVLTDVVGRFLPSFCIQFCYYMIHDFKNTPAYMTFLSNAQKADSLWWNDQSAPSYEWGLGAGSTPSGYHADAVNNNPDMVVAPHIISGFIPVDAGSRDDLLSLYMNNKGVYGLPDNQSNKIIWRYSFSSPGWTAGNVEGIDFSTMLFGLASLEEHLGADFFDAFNDVDIVVPGLPLAPTGLSSAGISGSKIRLSWTDNADNEVFFRIERSPNGTDNWTQVTAAGKNATGCTDAGLNSSTTYYYRICASNAAGNSDFSNIASDTTHDVLPPAAPDSLNARAVTFDQIDLSWKDYAFNEDGFRIERKTDNNPYSEVGVVDSNVTTYSNSGLSDSTTYTYRVCAFNAGGNSAFSNVDSATTLALKQMPYLGSPAVIPGVIEGENFDLGGEDLVYYDTTPDNQGGQYRQDEAVDIEDCSSGGYNVGWVMSGEWLEYTVDVVSLGTYQIDVATASESQGGSIRFKMNGLDVTGNVSLPVTGKWQTWKTTTIPNVVLEAGKQVMRVEIAQGGFNLDKMIFSPSASAVDDPEIREIPAVFSLSQNYPNPFNPNTTIRYSLPVQSFVDLKVFNIRGEEVVTLVEEEQPAGNYDLDFDGSELNSGIYFYAVEAGEYKNVRKMILLK
jgi:hypothetical protein